MNRRAFLAAFAVGGAGLLAPKRAYSFLWAPPAPEILYVDSTGMRRGSYRSIKSALRRLGPNQGRIIIDGGKYDERVVVPRRVSLEAYNAYFGPMSMLDVSEVEHGILIGNHFHSKSNLRLFS